MSTTDPGTARLVHWIGAEIKRSTGRSYPQLTGALDALDHDALLDMQRMLRDLDAERRMAVQRAKQTPWR